MGFSFFVFLGRVSPLWFENKSGFFFGRPDSRSFLLIETYHKITWKKREMLVFEYQKEKGRRKKLTNPIRSSTQRSTFIPHTQTIDFGRIQPRHTLHSNSKKDIIQEEKRHTRRSDFLLIRIPGQFRVAQENGDEHIARSLAERSVNEHFATTPSFDIGDSDERKEEVADAVAGGEETGHHIGETDGFDEHGGEIVARDVDSGELLNGLRAHS